MNPSSASLITDGSIENPWKTILQANQITQLLKPGDTVFFKRGERFNGTLTIGSSGATESPIVITAYGTGTKPSFTNTTTNVIVIRNQQHVIVDGLKIIDNTMDPNRHTITAKISYGIVIDNSLNCQIKNCDITLVGIGISVNNGSNRTTISGNYIYNLRMVRNTVGGNDDFGANAMVIGSSENSITNNRFEECWANSYDYSYDGGAVEFFGQQMNRNKIMNNTSINCAGFIEIGSNTQGTASDNLIAYNKIINNGYSGVFHNSSTFKVAISGLKYFNNVIIETKAQYAYPKRMFWASDTTALINIVEFRNNIVWLETGIGFGINSNKAGAITHSNNIFKVSNGSSVNVILDATESITNAVGLFKNTTGVVTNWDFHLAPGSIAIDAGIDLGILYDFEGNPIRGMPDIGIYEFDPTILRASAKAEKISCFGESTSVTVSATGGAPPYSGTETYTNVVAGSYSYIVSDSENQRDTININIEQPAKLLLSLSSGLITTATKPTTISALATGGTSPYLYSLNGGPYQSSGTFNNIYPGTYTVTAKDANTCTTNKMIVAILTETTLNPDKQLLIKVYPNPSSSSFTLSQIKYRGQPVNIKIKVINQYGIINYTAQGSTNVSYVFGMDFEPGRYTLVAEVATTVQAMQLIKL
ncbi:MAG: right-handed parallel beta-helix repeat-containing protein [bacterium]